MRLIDADALINDIEEFITEHEEMMKDSEEHPENYPEDYKTRVLNLIAGLIAANVEVANAPTIEAEWIPCSERFPREYAQYLVCFKSGECYVYWLEDSDWTRGMAEKEGIIAWMPLPKPYREDGEK